MLIKINSYKSIAKPLQAISPRSINYPNASTKYSPNYIYTGVNNANSLITKILTEKGIRHQA